MSRKRTLENVKTGDRVIVRDGRSSIIYPVVRLTPTQIILDIGRHDLARYQRGKPPSYPHLDPEPTYYKIGHVGWNTNEIIAIATKDECAKWDAQREVAKQQAMIAQQERERIEALQAELRGLFDGQHVSVQESFHNAAGDWQVQMWMSEEKVRALAELLRTNETIK